MGEKRVTIMVLKVDLQCEKCYRKVKQVLCQFPQIRDQSYDEKNNLVIIKVVCCSPEKIRDKLCCKGCGVIKSIEIIEPKPPAPPAPKPQPKPPAPPAPAPAPAPPPAPKPAPAPAPPPAPKPAPAPPPAPAPAPAPPPAPKPPPAPTPAPVPACPAPMSGRACCMECYGGHPGGPCETGYGGYGGAAPYIQYDGYYGRPVYDSYGSGRGYAPSSCCITRPDCFSEENPHACAIM